MLSFRTLSIGFLLIPFLLCGANATDIHAKKILLANTTKVTSTPFFEMTETFLKDLRSKGVEKVYNDYTSKEFRKKTSLEEFKKMLEKFKLFSESTIFQFQSFFVEEGIASLGGDLYSETGKAVPIEFDFVQEDGKWKILGMQIYENEASLPVHEEQ